MCGQANGLHASSLIHGYVEGDRALAHTPEILAKHEDGRALPWKKDLPDQHIRRLDLLGDPSQKDAPSSGCSESGVTRWIPLVAGPRRTGP